MVDIIFYDVEVFAYDWTVTFKSLRTGEYTFIHNNNYQVKEFMKQPRIILAGWNNKMYDDYILLAMMVGADPQTLKRLNDWIIEEHNLPWEFPFLRGYWKDFDSFDLRDDLYRGLSLKEAEGNMNMNIEESSISFNIDRPLTPEEVEEIKQYNKADVDATERVFHARKKNYLRPKVEVGKMIGLSAVESLRMTNGKLTARVLNAKKRNWNDERQYKIPKNINIDRLPREILEFYLRMYQDISDEELYKGPFDEKKKKIHIYYKGSEIIAKGKKLKKEKLKELGVTHEWFDGKLRIYKENIEYVYGFGGVHAGISNYQDESSEDKLILLWDVRSLYPSIMIEFGYLSRNVPNSERFKEIYYERIEAKKNNEKIKSDSLKLVLNTAYGVLLNKYNDMFDPLMGRSVCLTGQLSMTDLTMGLKEHCPTFECVQLNTDGIMFSISPKDLDIAYEVGKEWQERTGLVLEEDRIKKIVQKDVNNYCMQLENGEIVAVGTMVKNYHGGSLESNDVQVVHRAIVDYLLFDKPVEETIYEEDNIFNFQTIAKTGSTFLGTYHTINGKRYEVQRVNRVYSTKDKKYGTIEKYKIDKNGEDRYVKIPNLPAHCIVDNKNELSIEDIDKDFYINLAKRRIKLYLGGK